ncbi:MAG: hypothetical protein ACOWWR_11585 [Eubacteriales bacterium]
MQEYSPPINKRSTEDLVSIAHSTNNEWQNDAIKQAKSELKARNISLESQKDIISKWAEKDKRFEEQFNKWLDNNKDEKYTYWEMFKVLVSAPFILAGRAWEGDSLSELKHFNFKIKFKQRLILLISGVLLWIIFIFGSVKISEIKFMREIEEVDISDWKNNRIVNDKEE